MALLDKVVKQRMVGALVLVALAVIFLPMLFSREDEMRQVRVEAPAAPAAPSMPQVQVEPVSVPEPQVLPDEAPVVVDESTTPIQAPTAPIAPAPTAVPAPAPAPAPVVAEKPATPPPAVKPQAQPAAAVASAAKPAAGKIDANGLPISWSVQLASLSSRAGADNLQKNLRSQGYNAYIRSAGGMNRVYVGPLIERAEAERLRDAISRKQKLNGIIVRFQPERG
jgi:DedD protein